MAPELTRHTHWDQVWTSRDPAEVSWFEPSATMSRELISSVVSPPASVVDVGGGASRLVDELLDSGHEGLCVVDIAAPALEVAKARLGQAASAVDWVVADVTTWRPTRQFDVWHDRAVLHFLTDPADQAAYAATVNAAVAHGGFVVIGAFAPTGPEACSGLSVQRHDATSIMAVLGERFTLRHTREHDHITPGGAAQRFTWVVAGG
jgi:SAM-dependent methyltransferase